MQHSLAAMCVPGNRANGYSDGMPNPAEYPTRAAHAFNARDADGLAALWSPDVVYEAPGGERTVGIADAVARERLLWTAFSDVRATLAAWLATDDRLVLEGVMRGTHDGPLRIGDDVVSPTSRRIVVPFVALFTFANGLVAHERVAYDRLDLLRQVGVVPS
jgi:ketosteroid isomerase-like protein